MAVCQLQLRDDVYTNWNSANALVFVIHCTKPPVSPPIKKRHCTDTQPIIHKQTNIQIHIRMFRKVLIPAVLVLSVHGKRSNRRRKKGHRRSEQAKRRLAERMLFTEDQGVLPPHPASVESARHSDRSRVHQQRRNTVSRDAVLLQSVDVQESEMDPMLDRTSEPIGEAGMDPVFDRPSGPTGETRDIALWMRAFDTVDVGHIRRGGQQSSRPGRNDACTDALVWRSTAPNSDVIKEVRPGFVPPLDFKRDTAGRLVGNQKHGEAVLDGGQSLAGLGICAKTVLGVVRRPKDNVTALRRDLGVWFAVLKDQHQEIIDKAVHELGRFPGKAILLIRFPARLRVPNLCIRKAFFISEYVYTGHDHTDSDLWIDAANARFLGYSLSGERPENFVEIRMG